MHDEEKASVLRATVYAAMAVLLTFIASIAATDAYGRYLESRLQIACIESGKAIEVVDLIEGDQVQEVEVCR